MNNANNTEYNVTIWRLQNGQAFSCCVARLDNGRISRINGISCHPLAGTPAYHDAIVKYLSEFSGQPCEITVSNGTKGYKEAIRKRIHEAWTAQNQRPLASVIRSL